jgi:hypothetical protein
VTLFLEKPLTKIGLVEWFKVKALSSSPSTEKTKIKTKLDGMGTWLDEDTGLRSDMERRDGQWVCSLAERVHLSLETHSLPCQSIPFPSEFLQPLFQGFALFFPLIVLLLQEAHSLLAA